jgi:DNA-binding NtrC family response regulator
LTFKDIITRSAKMQGCCRRAKTANSAIPVLIEGESGSARS